MRHALRVCAACLAAAAVSGVLAADKSPYGSAAEAKAMIDRVITELKADPTAAIGKFNDPAGSFRDRDLYVYCFDSTTGKFTAQVNKSLLGTDNRLLKEKDGSPLGQKVYDAAHALKDGQVTTVSCNYPRPGTDNAVPKVAYVTRVGNTACGVGYYKP
jgi:hypothetical protein